MLNPVVLSLACILFTARTVSCGSCHMAWADDGHQPSFTTGCYAANNLCYKSYRSTVAYNQDGSVATSKVEYAWNCASEVPDLSAFGLKCGDIYEITEAGRDYHSGLPQSTYTRYCTCCGSNCNDKLFDDKCNETPEFTTKCYGAGGGKPKLDQPEMLNGTAEIPCTASQACFKKWTTRKINYDDPEVEYVWGCATPPTKQCGEYYTDKVNTRCTCCGDLCNGQDMDKYSNKTLPIRCRAVPPAPTTTTKTTTPTPKTTTTTTAEPAEPQSGLTTTETVLIVATSALGVIFFIFVIVLVNKFQQLSSAGRPKKTGKTTTA